MRSFRFCAMFYLDPGCFLILLGAAELLEVKIYVYSGLVSVGFSVYRILILAAVCVSAYFLHTELAII